MNFNEHFVIGEFAHIGVGQRKLKIARDGPRQRQV